MPGNINILVADDEQVIRSLIFDVLSDSGFNVLAVSGAEEAVEKIRQCPFEIIITDLKMPGTKGVELISRLKEIEPNVCIIVITGFPSIETAVEVMRAGAYDYLAKPFNLEELRIIVKRAADMQLLQREKESLRALSITDGLTDIYNHRYFKEILSKEVVRAVRYSSRLSLIMFDIDDFKVYNDANGHPVGDEVLRQTAKLLTQVIRRIDFAFRYGGEEFAVVLPETEKNGAISVARRIQDRISQEEFKFAYFFPAGRLTVSAGLAVCPDDARSKEELITKADQALYKAKQFGKNRVCFFEAEEIKTVC